MIFLKNCVFHKPSSFFLFLTQIMNFLTLSSGCLILLMVVIVQSSSLEGKRNLLFYCHLYLLLQLLLALSVLKLKALVVSTISFKRTI